MQQARSVYMADWLAEPRIGSAAPSLHCPPVKLATVSAHSAVAVPDISACIVLRCWMHEQHGTIDGAHMVSFDASMLHYLTGRTAPHRVRNCSAETLLRSMYARLGVLLQLVPSPQGIFSAPSTGAGWAPTGCCCKSTSSKTIRETRR